MITILSKKDCCGCSACVNVCPTTCISMESDEEGFLYPTINESSCVHCDRCKQICPILNVQPIKPYDQDAYLAQNIDIDIRMDSTSGGVFTALATSCLEKGGIVFGAAIDNDFNVKHLEIDQVKQLAKFRNSKYVQSAIGKSYLRVKEYLDTDKVVCFSGTPCQIEGLKCFLEKDYSKLYCIDVVCRAVPSPLVLNKYLLWHQKKANNKVKNIRFRDKTRYGYRYSQIEVTYFDSQIDTYYGGKESDPYLQAFFGNYCDRPSCHECHFKNRYRNSDITLWDAQDCSQLTKELNDNKGTSKVLIHSNKGHDLWEASLKYMKLIKFKPEEIIKNVYELENSVKPNKNRDTFMKDVVALESEELFDKYFPYTWQTKVKKYIKVFLVKTELYDFVKSKVVKYVRR